METHTIHAHNINQKEVKENQMFQYDTEEHSNKCNKQVIFPS